MKDNGWRIVLAGALALAAFVVGWRLVEGI